MSSPALERHRTHTRPIHGPGTTGERALAAVVPGPPRPATTAFVPVIGRYRCDADAGSWWWSADMFRLHGLERGVVDPSTELLLASQHPADRSRMLAALAGAREGRPFALEVRLVRPDGAMRTVVVVGEPLRDADGTVTGVEGTCIDLTDGRRGPDRDRLQALETEVTQLRTAMASRAAIEQAKGILMLLTNCGEQVAFELLAHISSHCHRKVRDVALAITESAAGHGGLPDDIRAILRDACPPAKV